MWLVLAASLFGLRPAQAATFHAHDGPSLQAAVQRADSVPAPNTIELSAGTYTPAATLTLNGDIVVAGPSAAPGAKVDGGAVQPFPSDLLVVETHAKVTLRNLELTTAAGPGSGAAIDDFGVLDIESSTLAGNNGPGLLVQPGGDATLRDSTLSDGLDFGIVDSGSANLLSSTVAGNVGGGVDDAGGTLSLTNTIIAGNGATDCTKPAGRSDHSLDGDGSCGVGALSHSDPLLGRLALNGGPTPTRPLDSGSPAVGAGDASRCPAHDQRGFSRTGDRCDIGAYQSGAAAPRGTGAAPDGTFPEGTRRGRGSRRSDARNRTLAKRFTGVSAHGMLRGSRRPPIKLALSASATHRRASFRYEDRAGGIVLRSLAVRSLVFDGRLRTATLSGSALELPTGRRVRVALVLTAGRRRLVRIRLSGGYLCSGRLFAGSIVFTH